MLLDAQMDHGPVLSTQTYTLPTDAYYPEIKKELATMGARLLSNRLSQWIAGEITPTPQDDTRATFCALITRADGRIAWNNPAGHIYNHIRALASEPGTWTTWHGTTLAIHQAQPTQTPSPETPGTVIVQGNFVDVATSTCYLRLTQIQPEGGKPMNASAFAHGHPTLHGSLLE
mgnify:CR=1 FL=1